MSKELFISSSPHETKVAVLEDDLLVEVYYERDTDVGLVGGIYKGRVSRVLPGMQSAFVDIGLERDAFLYVSDFFLEDQEEYEKIFEEAEDRATRFAEEAKAAETKAVPAGGLAIESAPTLQSAPVESVSPTTERAAAEASIASPGAGSAPAEEKPVPPPSSPPPSRPRYTSDQTNYRRPEHRGRRRRRRGSGFSEHRFAHRPEETALRRFEILPGESLAKYSHTSPGLPAASKTVGAPDGTSAEAGAAGQQ